MSTDTSLRRAVRGLRLALGKTQTEFGALIGKSLPTIQRFETLVPPRGKILLKLETLARESRLDEYAQRFRQAVRDDLGLDLPEIEVSPVGVPFPIMLGPHIPEPTTDEQKRTHDALQALFHAAQWPGKAGERARKDLKLVVRGLRRTRLQLEEGDQSETQVLADRVAALTRLTRDGMAPEQIAEKMHMSKAEVDFLLSEYGGGRK